MVKFIAGTFTGGTSKPALIVPPAEGGGCEGVVCSIENDAMEPPILSFCGEGESRLSEDVGGGGWDPKMGEANTPRLPRGGAVRSEGIDKFIRFIY